jgi:hypothetical protein
MDSFMSTLKNVELKGDKTQSELTTKTTKLTQANQQLTQKCSSL